MVPCKQRFCLRDNRGEFSLSLQFLNRIVDALYGNACYAGYLCILKKTIDDSEGNHHHRILGVFRGGTKELSNEYK